MPVGHARIIDFAACLRVCKSRRLQKKKLMIYFSESGLIKLVFAPGNDYLLILARCLVVVSSLVIDPINATVKRKFRPKMKKASTL